ncbi:hypothetical protein K438DRAFT_1780739 [Mycena galopus ATCC 62051]|nr:hypothetical protein K438DRAFT_1780739 [Mycena galopus ATCC 62051]
MALLMTASFRQLTVDPRSSLGWKHPRNTQQPDRETALECLEAGLDSEGLAVFLNTNPARLPGSGENASDIHLRLFAPSGTYKKVAVLREELEKLRAGWAVTEKIGKSQQA